jgi:hypothetical protein
MDAQVAYLEAMMDVDGDRLVTAKEILDVFQQVWGSIVEHSRHRKHVA